MRSCELRHQIKLTAHTLAEETPKIFMSLVPVVRRQSTLSRVWPLKYLNRRKRGKQTETKNPSSPALGPQLLQQENASPYITRRATPSRVTHRQRHAFRFFARYDRTSAAKLMPDNAFFPGLFA